MSDTLVAAALAVLAAQLGCLCWGCWLAFRRRRWAPAAWWCAAATALGPVVCALCWASKLME